MPNVVFQIKVFVIQPVRIIQLERRLLETAAKVRRRVQAIGYVLQDFLVPHQPAWRTALITQPETADHHRLVWCLKVEEVGIHWGQLFHGRRPQYQLGVSTAIQATAAHNGIEHQTKLHIRCR
ncbi:hypothetical protein UMZ34_03035 [Halopseudomonas pachastrellae]|nr:hypothetical protein UMZ34_03035 [Halopseudomonas pachastrellae]